MKRKIITMVLVLSMIFSVTAVYATSTDSKIKQKEAELQQGQEKENALSEELSSIKTRIKTTTAEIKVLEGKIASAQNKIQIKTKKLNKKKKEIEKGMDGLNSRLRNMYKSGSVGFIDVILSSENIKELLSNVELVKYIYKGDKELVATLKKEYKKIDKEQDELIALKDSIKDEQVLLAEKKNALLADKVTVASKKNEVSAQNKLTSQELAQLKADAAAIDQQISNSTTSNGVSGSYGGGVFNWPMAGTVTQEFGGMYSGWPHRGLDIGAPAGTSIVAAASGKVILSQYGNSSYGNYLVISHGSGLTTLYAHCSSLSVSAGRSVVKGQVIAHCGSTGNSSGPHLHFEVSINGALQNPRNYL